MHAALSEAVGAGLIYPDGSSYSFLHDRIQQAAYSLVPQEDCAEVHLTVGRALLAKMATTKLAEHLFDVANHFNRGAALLVEDEEKIRVRSICVPGERQTHRLRLRQHVPIFRMARHYSMKGLGAPATN